MTHKSNLMRKSQSGLGETIIVKLEWRAKSIYSWRLLLSG